MTSRDTILNAIRRNKPQELSLPVIDKEAAITYPDLYAQFKNVLEAIGVRDADAVLRFSLSRLTTAEDVEKAMAALRQAVDEIAAVVDGGLRP